MSRIRRSFGGLLTRRLLLPLSLGWGRRWPLSVVLGSLEICSSARTQLGQAQLLNLGAPSLPLLAFFTSHLLAPLPVSELESALQMEPAAFQPLYSAEKPKLDDENLVFFCQKGRRGFQATQLAQSLGYTGARNYAGAYQEWLEKVG
ncbi:thiosulfate:glutathione sulfurtransferase isoform X1 [Fukomys damarensis]|uniref:thiosulfate:glutathione sulfurtransferase isoform X1 n=1 Tax=Fukomys damarensis TaxID=885580 RepID=UPI00053F4A4C|nr:thiosulfate:glutathione sulfurtransferase isoform X1 [Fukomys damarensis]